MAGPLVSIIIPTRNAEATLVNAVKSIINQTWSHWEVIVQDGGSTDGTLESEVLIDGRIHVFQEKDSGVYDAMNKAIEHAKGEWLIFLGANDTLASPTILSEMLAIADDKADLIFGDVKYVNRVSHKIPRLHRGAFGNVLKWRNGLHHQGTLYNARCFGDWRYDPTLKVLADYDLNLRLWKQGAIAIRLDEIIARCDGSGISKKFNKSLYSEERRVKKRWLSGMDYRLAGLFTRLKYVWKRG